MIEACCLKPARNENNFLLRFGPMPWAGPGEITFLLRTTGIHAMLWCSNNWSQLNILKKIVNWFQLVSSTFVP